MLFLWFARKYLAKLLVRTGLPAKAADMAAKLAPMLVVIVSTAVVSLWGLDRSHGVPVVGTVPQGLPALGLPAWDWGSVQALWLPALLISLVGFVESVSVAQSLALKRQQRIEPNRELLGWALPTWPAPCRGLFRSPVGLPARSSILLPVPTHRWQASSPPR